MTLASPRFSTNQTLVSAENNNPALRRGSRGEGIRILQKALIDLGYPMPRSVRRHGSPDGIYGKEMIDKVKHFQSSNKPLSRDGVVGGNTLRKLDNLLPTAGTPLPPLPRGSLTRIIYNVPLIRQGHNPICWVACAAMILSFKKHRPISIGDINNGFDPSNSSMSNPALTMSSFYRQLADLGFKVMGPHISPGVDFIPTQLADHGPFMLTHYTKTLAPAVQGLGTHAVVITGVDMEKDKVFFNNPWGHKNDSTSVSTIMGSLERLWAQNVKSVAYIR